MAKDAPLVYQGETMLLQFTFPARRWKHLALQFGFILVTFGDAAEGAAAPASLSPASLEWKNDKNWQLLSQRESRSAIQWRDHMSNNKEKNINE